MIDRRAFLKAAAAIVGMGALPAAAVAKFARGEISSVPLRAVARSGAVTAIAPAGVTIERIILSYGGSMWAHELVEPGLVKVGGVRVPSGSHLRVEITTGDEDDERLRLVVDDNGTNVERVLMDVPVKFSEAAARLQGVVPVPHDRPGVGFSGWRVENGAPRRVMTFFSSQSSGPEHGGP